eukprot:Pgem_evm1s248
MLFKALVVAWLGFTSTKAAAPSPHISQMFKPHCDGRGPSVISDQCIEQYFKSDTIHNPQQDRLKDYYQIVEKLEGAQVLANSKNNNSVHEHERNMLFVFMIHAPTDLELMEYWLSSESPIFDNDNRHHYIIVPDERMYNTENKAFVNTQLFFNRWNSRKNVHVVENKYSIYGSWGGSSLVYKEIIGYLKAFELNLEFSHAILTSATALPVKTIDEMMEIYKEDIAYASIWPGATLNKVSRTEDLFYDCGGCVYKVKGKSKKEIYNRTAPKVLDDWQENVANGTYWNNIFARTEHPLSKGAQWKALTKKLIHEVLFGEKSQLFKQYLEFFETVWIPDEHFWPTLLNIEYLQKNRTEVQLAEHVKSLWHLPNMLFSVEFMQHQFSNGLTRWEVFRNDIGTTHLRKLPPINETKKIVETLFSYPYKPQEMKESETQDMTYFTWKEMFTNIKFLLKEKIFKDPVVLKNFYMKG